MKKLIKNNPEITALILIGIISLIIAIALTKTCNEFLDTMRGVAYEGVILASLVGVLLAITQKHSERLKSEIRTRERTKSRDSLVKILSLLCEAYYVGGTFHWTKHIKNAASFEVNFSKFQETKRKQKTKLIDQLKQKEFKNSCEHNLPTIYAHIPIAEKLSPKHLNAWIGICSLVSLTVNDGLDPSMILDEFEEFAFEFSKAPVGDNE